MRRVAFALVVLLAVGVFSPAAAGIYYGWKSYDSMCHDLDAKSEGARTLGVDYRFGLLKFVKLAVGLDYSWGDVDADCDGCDAASFSHFAGRAGVDVPFWRPSITEVYVGGGLSYNWVSDPSDIECQGDNQRSGIYGHAGVKVSTPVLPFWFLLEGRYETLTGEPTINVSSFMLGVGFGF